MLSAPDTIETERQLALRNDQLKTIVEVTQAVISNMPPNELLKYYRTVAEEKISEEKLSLYVFNKAWSKQVNINSDENLTDKDLNQLLENYKASGELNPDEDLYAQGFKYAIPIYYDDKPIAFALSGKFNQAGVQHANAALEFAHTVTSIISIEVENQRLWQRERDKVSLDTELEVAARIQNTLVPSALPNNNLYEFAGSYVPHKNIGGDYYDVININRDELVFCIADISGKGVAAALVMANLQAYLNAIENFDLEDKRFIERLNHKVFSITNGEKFITLFIAKYNIRSRELIYINAGHNWPILIRGNDNKEILLKNGCTLLGAMEEIPTITYGRESIPKGSTIVTYTDGLTELENEEGKQYTLDRLRLFTMRNHQLSPSIFIKSLNNNLAKFKGGRLFSDDISLLTCKFW